MAAVVGAVLAATVTAGAPATAQVANDAQNAELRRAGLIGAGESWACEGSGAASVTSCLSRFGYSLGGSVTWGGGTFLPYAGNCVHYAAWRAIQAGAPSIFDTKSADGVSSYNAENWDSAARNGNRRAAVDRTPARGAIAQWDGTGYSNHVGYVEYVGYAADGSVAWFATSEAKYDGGKGGARRAVYNRGSAGFEGAEFIHVGGAVSSPTPPAASAPVAAPVAVGPVVAAEYRRTPDATVYAVAGGAKYALSLDEYLAMGSPAFQSVAAGALDGYPTAPTGVAYMRNAGDGTIYQVVGGAAYGLTWDDWVALGKPTAVDVPAGFILRADATAPDGVWFLRDSGGVIYQVVGGVKYALTLAEWQALGTPAYTQVPAGFAARISTGAPSGAWFLRDSGGVIYQVVGGVKYALTLAEWQALGTPAYTQVPAGFAARISTGAPSGAWFLRDSGGVIYQVVGGVKYALTLAEWQALGTPAYIQVPNGLVAPIPTGAPSGTWVLRDPVTLTIYEVVGGAKLALTWAEWQALGAPTYLHVASGFLAAIPEGSPAGPLLLRDVTTGEIYSITGGTKRLLSLSEYTEMGSPSFTNVPTRWLSSYPAGV